VAVGSAAREDCFVVKCEKADALFLALEKEALSARIGDDLVEASVLRRGGDLREIRVDRDGPEYGPRNLKGRDDL